MSTKVKVPQTNEQEQQQQQQQQQIIVMNILQQLEFWWKIDTFIDCMTQKEYISLTTQDEMGVDSITRSNKF
jgi:uncharacterized protein YjgD (DUF1641 family)